MLQAGLDGIRENLDPPPPVDKNIYNMSVRERRRHKIAELPSSLNQALIQLKKNKVIQEALGPHIYKQFLQAKQLEWNTYIQQVHSWETESYLGTY